ncbi:MAG: hypothetical protein JNM79_00750 [Burkholderiales bacterium]|nr:hypothetical protein [Burkholderiales bacterium]
MLQALLPSGRRLTSCVLAAVLSVPASLAFAAGYDVLVGQSAGRLTAGFFAHGGVPPAGGFGFDYLANRNLYTADFGDFAGGPRKTDDPGFQSFAGALPADTLVYARGIGTLQFWTPSAPAWSSAAAGTFVRLDGAVPTDIATAYLFCEIGDEFLCNPALAAQFTLYEQGTRISGTGISGPNPALIDEAAPNGSFHAHLDWEIGKTGGTPANGAYLIGLSLAAPGYADSTPFSLLFNYGLTSAQFQTAYASLATPPLPAVPEPAVWVMLALGAALVARTAARKTKAGA